LQSLFISATGTNIGKTHTALKLIEALSKHGYKVGVYKPIETGVQTIAADAKILLDACQKVNTNFKELTIEDITAYTFPLPAAPFCADTKKTIELNVIMAKYNALLKLCDILIVEGAGGLMVPVDNKLFMIDIAKKMNAQVLLITPSYLGCINETILSIKALEMKGVSFDWCVNLYQDKERFKKVTQPFYDHRYPNWWHLESGLDSFIDSL